MFGFHSSSKPCLPHYVTPPGKGTGSRATTFSEPCSLHHHHSELVHR
jgi:hypothetical protein